jgi:hypothetical protein
VPRTALIDDRLSYGVLVNYNTSSHASIFCKFFWMRSYPAEQGRPFDDMTSRGSVELAPRFRRIRSERILLPLGVPDRENSRTWLRRLVRRYDVSELLRTR